MDRLVLHVGTMKSGTTFVQDQLFEHRSALGQQGILVPGATWQDHVDGVKDVLGHGDREPGSWTQLLAGVPGPGTAVVSMEFLARVPVEAARRVVASSPVPVHVVVTARDLTRQLPAMWQETLKNGHTWSWREYRESARVFCPHQPTGADRIPSPAGQNFWRQQNLPRILAGWQEATTPGSVTVVPVPRPGGSATDLWELFGRAVGFDAGGMAPGPARNTSMGAASAQVLLRANQLFEEHGLPFPAGKTLRKRRLANQVLAGRRAAEPSIGIDVDPWVLDYSRHQIAEIHRLAPNIVGEIEDLLPAAVPGADPETVDPDDVTEAAVHALVEMLLPRVRKDQA